MRIAMWSGPRNLSTAMMYSFLARGDCAVWDEPFYGAYLADSGLDHPLRAEILECALQHPDEVIANILAPNPDGKSHYYQKHMTHHMLPDYDLGWVTAFKNLFLIRHPARVIASYLEKREAPTVDDIGFQRQSELFDQIGKLTGQNPAVFDADDIRNDPEGSLRKMCEKVGIMFTETMLHWPAGPKDDDGPWAPHWYGAVHESTGFAGPDGPLPDIPGQYRELLADALVHYRRLRGFVG